MSKSMIVNCPHCGKPVEWNDAAQWRPFCSQRCRLIDLGDWFEESHRIPATPDLTDENIPPPIVNTLPH